MENSEHQNLDFMIEAEPGIVEKILRENLTQEQLDSLELSQPNSLEVDDLHGSKRIIGAEELVATTCIAIAGNASYELLKVISVLLITKLGKDKVLQMRKNESDGQTE